MDFIIFNTLDMLYSTTNRCLYKQTHPWHGEIHQYKTTSDKFRTQFIYEN